MNLNTHYTLGIACILLSACIPDLTELGGGTHCENHRRDGDETGLDCGGTCAPDQQCLDGEACRISEDCASFTCTDGVCEPDQTIPLEDSIDNMESGEGSLEFFPTGTATSYISGDGSGLVLLPSKTTDFPPEAIPGGRGASLSAWHLRGGGFRIWGLSVGIDFSVVDGKKYAFDGRAYQGLTFWARSAATSTIAVAVSETETDPAAACVGACYDNFRATVLLTTSWTRYVVFFKDLKQTGFGAPLGEVDPSQLIGCQFLVSPNTDFDIWIDDIAFVRSTAAEPPY